MALITAGKKERDLNVVFEKAKWTGNTTLYIDECNLTVREPPEGWSGLIRKLNDYSASTGAESHIGGYIKASSGVPSVVFGSVSTFDDKRISAEVYEHSEDDGTRLGLVKGRSNRSSHPFSVIRLSHAPQNQDPGQNS